MKKEEIAVKKVSKTKKISHQLKEEVKENLFNIPNTLSVLRIFIVFAAVYMLFSGYPIFWVGVVFAIGAFTDFLDGFLARRLKQTTSIGARLDQVSDRVFQAIMVIALAVFWISNDKSVLMLFLVSSREIIGLPGLLIRFVRNKDTYKVKYIGKITTFIQYVAISLLIIEFPYAFPFVVATCLAGILAGLDYLRDSFN